MFYFTLISKRIDIQLFFGYGLADNFSSSCTAWMVPDFRKGIAFFVFFFLPPSSHKESPRHRPGTVPKPVSRHRGWIHLLAFFSIQRFVNGAQLDTCNKNSMKLWHKMPLSITFRIPIIVTTAVETSGQLNNYYCFFIFNVSNILFLVTNRVSRFLVNVIR